MKDATLKAALLDAGITERLSPVSFPEGTVVEDIQVRQETGELFFFATYELLGEKFYISIRSAANISNSEVEINDPNVETYIVGGIEHHIMMDVLQCKAIWNSGSWECSIAGKVEKEDIMRMIDSIYE